MMWTFVTSDEERVSFTVKFQMLHKRKCSSCGKTRFASNQPKLLREMFEMDFKAEAEERNSSVRHGTFAQGAVFPRRTEFHSEAI